MLVDPEIRLLAAMERNKPVIAGHRRHERLAEAKDERVPAPGYVRVQRNVLAVQKPRPERVPDAERAEMARLYREIVKPGCKEPPDICKQISARLDPPHSSLCVATILLNDLVRPKKPPKRTGSGSRAR
jgi:hypothetical protein